MQLGDSLKTLARQRSPTPHRISPVRSRSTNNTDSITPNQISIDVRYEPGGVGYPCKNKITELKETI